MTDVFTYKDGSLYWSGDFGGKAKKGVKFGCVTPTTIRGTYRGVNKNMGEWVFKFFNGHFPRKLIFINGDNFDCRIENLVDMTNAERGSKEWSNFFFDYNDGVVTWKVGLKGVKPGSVAGTINSKGYRVVMVCGKHILEHRLVWSMFNGLIPEGLDIDHADGNTINNNISNLRVATRQQNSRNRSDVKGVCLVSRTGKWQASIQVGGKSIHLGTFTNESDAKKARVSAEERIFKEFSPRKRGGHG